jgi:hypothetical protein
MNRREFNKIAAMGTISLALGNTGQTATARKYNERPNILVIMTDQQSAHLPADETDKKK